MVKGSQSYYDRIRAMTEIGHTTLVVMVVGYLIPDHSRLKYYGDRAFAV